ncbi:MAG: TerB N-terminal domain-containing protein [Clostridia bacterium]
MDANITKIIDDILKNSKVANFEVSKTSEKSTVKPEPILKRASEIAPPISPKYKQLFNIFPKEHTNFWEPIYLQEQFYLQAKFMEDFEDNYPSFIHSYRYFPRYSDFSIPELRAYFTWRAKVRSGIVTQNSQSFVYLYLYELINGIGVKSPTDGLDKILFIWFSYRKFDKKIDTFLLWWIKDYYILCLSDVMSYKELISSLPVVPEDNELMLYELVSGKFENNLSFFNKYGSYKIMSSRFYKGDNIPIINTCFCYVFTAIKKFCEQKNIDFQNLFIGKTTGYYQISFYRNAIYYDTKKYKDTEIFITPNDSYICKNGSWKARHISVQAFLSKNIIGYILKNMEIEIRTHVGYKYKLSTNTSGIVNECYNRNFIENYSPLDFFKLLLSKEFTDIISTAVSTAFKENNFHSNVLPKPPIPPPEITFDTDKFEEIRKKASIIQKKLIIDEKEDNTTEKEEEKDINEVVTKLPTPFIKATKAYEKTNDTEITTLINSLDETELLALKLILNETPNEITKITDIMTEVLLENINEKALTYIGDNIIDTTCAYPIIYDDYKSDLRGNEKLI